MALKDYERARNQQPRWRLFVIALAICGLTVSVATRTFRLTVPHSTTVRSNSPHAMRQHLDRDATKWLPPAPVLTTLKVPVFYPSVAPAVSPLPSVLFDKKLDNRPPPAC